MSKLFKIHIHEVGTYTTSVDSLDEAEERFLQNFGQIVEEGNRISIMEWNLRSNQENLDDPDFTHDYVIHLDHQGERYLARV